MEFLKETGIFLWSIINNWAGYTTGGLVVATLGFWSMLKQRPIPRKLAIIVSAIFFALAIINAWRDQYHAAKGWEQKFEETSTPNLQFVAYQLFAQGGEKDSNVLALVRIKNLGAPSVIEYPKIALIHADGTTTDSLWISMPDRPIILSQPNGTSVNLPPSSFLTLKAGESPVPRNGAVEGFFWVKFPGIDKGELLRSKARLSVKDALGKTLSVDTPITTGGLNSNFTDYVPQTGNRFALPVPK